MKQNTRRLPTVLSAIKPGSGAELFAFVLACIIAVGIPLFFKDHYFDINRSKLALFESSAYSLCAAGVLFHLVGQMRKQWQVSMWRGALNTLSTLLLVGVWIVLFWHYCTGTLESLLVDNRITKNAMLFLPLFFGVCIGLVDGPSEEKAVFRRFSWAEIGMMLFVLSAILSTLFSAHYAEAITGDKGRKSGLVFLLALYCMYLCLSRFLHKFQKGILCAYMLVGVAIAFLGILNFYKIDPLGFYERMRPDQVIIFMSTIGNINFFGFYLCVILAGLTFGRLYFEKRLARMLCAAGSFICFYGIIASRSDGALLGVAALCVIQLFTVLKSTRYTMRWMTLLMLCVGAFALARGVGLATAWHGYAFQGGMFETLIVGSSISFIALAAAAVMTLLLYRAWRKGVILPTKALRIALVVLLVLGMLLVLGAMAYCTWIEPTAQIGALTQFLRFDDAWATYRGFAWSRTITAYGQLDALQKIVGVGPDTTYYALEPYRDAAIEAAANGVFENSHNEYLQYLLTVGVLGLAGYVLLLFASVRDAYRMRRNHFAYILLLMLAVYAVMALVNVNQPVTVIQFFFVAAMVGSMRNAQPQQEKQRINEEEHPDKGQTAKAEGKTA